MTRQLLIVKPLTSFSFNDTDVFDASDLKSFFPKYYEVMPPSAKLPRARQGFCAKGTWLAGDYEVMPPSAKLPRAGQGF